MIFRILLWSIGLLLAIASRGSIRVQSQLSRDSIFVIESRDGVARSFVVRNRRVSSRGGRSSKATCTLRFRTAAIGTRILLAADAVGRIVEGFGTKDVECEGEAAYVLWFYQLTMGLAPWRRKPLDIWPQSYVAPDPDSKASARITREPAVAELSADSTAAARQRENVFLWQVGRGAVPHGKVRNHKIVVDMSSSSAGSSHE